MNQRNHQANHKITLISLLQYIQSQAFFVRNIVKLDWVIIELIIATCMHLATKLSLQTKSVLENISTTINFPK